MPLEIKYVGYGVMVFLLTIVAIQNIGENASTTFDAVARELDAPPIAAYPKPDRSLELRAGFEELATSIAPLAIEASLIPHNLMDRERVQNLIQSVLNNEFGNDWSVEVTCDAGWCNIKLVHPIGELIIDANDGSATKSVHLN
jgi:hypothetical protein